MNGEEEYEAPISTIPSEPVGMSQSSLQYQIDAKQALDKMKKLFIGMREEYDSKTGTMKETHKVEHQLINEAGANLITTPLENLSSPTYVLTDLEEDDVLYYTWKYGKDCLRALFIHSDDFELKSSAAGSIILDMFHSYVYATLRRSYMGGYLEFLKTQMKSVEIQRISPQTYKPKQEENVSRLPFVNWFRRKK